MRERISFYRKGFAYVFRKKWVQLLKMIFAAYGAAWGVIRFIAWLQQDDLILAWVKEHNPNLVLLISALLVTIVSAIILSPKLKHQKSFETPGTKIKIAVRKSILNLKNHTVVIPVNKYFDFHKEGTLVRAYIDKYYGGDILKFTDEINQRLATVSRFNNLVDLDSQAKVNDSKTFGNRIEYPYGTTVLLEEGGRKAILTVAADVEEDGTDSTSQEALSKGYSGLWNAIKRFGVEERIVISVWGYGQSASAYSRLSLVKLLLLTFSLSSHEKKITSDLLVNIRPKNTQEGLTLFDGLGQFLKNLEI